MHLIYHSDFQKHRQNDWHPESPERLKGVIKHLKEKGLWENIISPKKAAPEDFSLIHSERHIEKIKNFGEGMYDPDTYVHEDTFDLALRAAGGAVEGASLASEGEKSFALLRPPGHHATPIKAMGFCYFNNIAIAAAKLGKKTVILDFDGHHGNGTHDAFAAVPEVLFISAHNRGIFPGTGSARDIGIDEGEGFSVNFPFGAGVGDSTYEFAYREVMEPIVREFKPELILADFGADPHYRDMLVSLSLSSTGIVNMYNHVFQLADELTNGGVSVMLEGGYDIPVLSETIGGIISSARKEDYELKFTQISDNNIRGKKTVKEVKEIQSNYWNLK